MTIESALFGCTAHSALQCTPITKHGGCPSFNCLHAVILLVRREGIDWEAPVVSCVSAERHSRLSFKCHHT